MQRAFHEQFDDDRIRRREFEVAQFCGSNPVETLVVFGNVPRVERTAEEKMEIDAAVRVVKSAAVQQFNDCHAQAGFLRAFADGAVGRCLAGAAFAARKLSESGEGPVISAHTDENLAGVGDDGNGDGFGWRQRRKSIAAALVDVRTGPAIRARIYSDLPGIASKGGPPMMW